MHGDPEIKKKAINSKRAKCVDKGENNVYINSHKNEHTHWSDDCFCVEVWVTGNHLVSACGCFARSVNLFARFTSSTLLGEGLHTLISLVNKHTCSEQNTPHVLFSATPVDAHASSKDSLHSSASSFCLESILLFAFLSLSQVKSIRGLCHHKGCAFFSLSLSQMSQINAGV